jgi:hypothetical protein
MLSVAEIQNYPEKTCQRQTLQIAEPEFLVRCPVACTINVSRSVIDNSRSVIDNSRSATDNSRSINYKNVTIVKMTP